MDKNLQNIEDLFRDGLEDNEEIPSPQVWNGINTIINKDNFIRLRKKYNTLKGTSLLLFFLLLCFCIYESGTWRTTNYFVKNKSGTSTKAVASENTKETKKTTNKNVTISQEQLVSKDIRNNTILNANPKNNSYILPPRSFLTNKQYQKDVSADVKDIAIAPVALKQHYLSPNLSENRQKLKTTKAAEDKQIMIVSNSQHQINNILSCARQLNFLTADTINTTITPSSDLKRSHTLLVLTKNNPLIDIKPRVAQQAKNRQTKSSRFSITAFFSPDIASYTLKNNNMGSQPDDDNATQIKRTERHEFSSTSSFSIDYILKKRWTLQSGLTFSNTNITGDPKTVYAQADNNGDLKYRLNISSGYGYLIPSFQPIPSSGDSLKVTTLTHKLRYIGIPLAVKYNISKGKLKVEIMAGVAANLLTMGKVETEIRLGTNNEIDILNNIRGLKSIYITGQAGIGAEYKVTDKFSFILMPTARLALNSINKGAVVKTYPNSIGLAGGIRL